jgi:hypothetical protein
MMMSSVAIATPENIMPSVTLVISIFLTFGISDSWSRLALLQGFSKQ